MAHKLILHLHIFTLKKAYDSLAVLKSEFIAGNTEKAMSDITSGVNKYFHIYTANQFAFFSLIVFLLDFFSQTKFTYISQLLFHSLSISQFQKQIPL